ncbi:hypothetical protein ACFXKG_18445 [Streptomyces sp. NPDC059255]|uniref:hypothetical protein n=1 Tax=Streptomyces sp. NPDC059255 TaxID=3346793 RepID=UPI0036979639
MSKRFAPDCGAIKPDEECGECEACDEAEYNGIVSDNEAGIITDAEALARHADRGDI